MSEYESCSNPNKRKPNGKAQSCSKQRYVWIENFGEIPKGFVIHHINLDKKDNRIENLKMLSYSEHTLLHHKLRKEEKQEHLNNLKL